MVTSIISWNVNGIRAVQKKGFIDWLHSENPDILCIQETKAHKEQLDDALISPKGYVTHWHSGIKKGYSSVATFSKEEPLSVSTLEIEEFDNEGRAQIIEFKTVTVLNCYFPNSQPERARLDYKLRFNNAILDKMNELTAAGKNVVLCGDYNVAHTAIDLKNPKPNENNAGYYIEERNWMSKFLDNGYIDTFRHFNKDPDHYTWWSYRFKARERNIGWRIDYHAVNESFINQVKESIILKEILGSDHCPIKLVLK
jgi:exodeoxyribonuclease III